MTKRREFLRLSGIGFAAITFSSELSAYQFVKPPDHFSFQLGVASYSLRKFSMEDALKITQRLDISNITFKDFHLRLDAPDELITETLQRCNEAGIKLYGGGVIYMKNSEEVDQAFEYARKAGMNIIIGVPEHELLPYVEKKVKEYNIKLAIHNHGPGDKRYPSVKSAYDKIKNMDPRMGICMDIGHTKRINGDPVRDMKDYSDRIYDIHIKDVTQADEKGTTCEMGRGVIDIIGFLKMVISLNYTGTLALEYEKDADDPLPGMAESLGYVKGVLSVLKST